VWGFNSLAVFGPGAGHLLVLGAWRVLLVRQCLRLPAVGFAQLNRVWSASTIALPQLNHKKRKIRYMACFARRHQPQLP
jgi:hypothetical protein